MARSEIWEGAYKIPWDEPGFSGRMLAEHLSQEHDLASRRVEWIERQVGWIHEVLLGGRASRVLDLGCGPGFYSHRLAALGHECDGIDFGPASIGYAREHCPEGVRCEFVLGDIRQVEFGQGYDLAMVLYGELNVFSPAEALAILRKAHASLRSGGRMIVEIQSSEVVECVGRGETAEQEFEEGLFSERPHRCRTENRWFEEEKIAVQTFTVKEKADGLVHVYRSTTKAWPEKELIALLTEAGFCEAGRCEEWPCNTEDLQLWEGKKS